MVIDEQVIDRLVGEVRTLTDSVRSDFTSPAITDEEIKRALQRSSNRLYYSMVDTNENFFVIPIIHDLAKGQMITLPEDFYKIISVAEIRSEGNKEELEKADISQIYRDAYGSYYEYSFDRGSNRKKYVILSNFKNDQLLILPENKSEGKYDIKYSSEAPLLNGFRLPRGYEDFFVYDSAVDIAGASYSEDFMWKKKADKLFKEIESFMANRSSAYPNQVKRVQQDDPTIDSDTSLIL